ncbi:hypothetical protein DH2020_033781 [Rehmannia glutinosa]|uniref:RNase H type-1 domain-containing protein n=1 Tax=Rehmannia glutinosa TaxID=99300 RepID=A0ABR0VDS0_REHGL
MVVPGFAMLAMLPEGRFLADIRKVCVGIADPSLVEAMGVREALSWLKEKYQHVTVTVETNSFSVIKAIRGSSPNTSYFSDVIDDYLVMLKDLPLFSCIFVRRSMNRVAHTLAKATDFAPGVVYWEESPPSYFISVQFATVGHE